AGDAQAGLAWRYADTFIQDGDSSVYLGHLLDNEKTYIRPDSLRETTEVDPNVLPNGNGMGNYYAAMTLPEMLVDTTWWSKQVGDSLVEVRWKHLQAEHQQEERFVLTRTVIQDSASADFHLGNQSFERWTFEAPLGLPVLYEQSWYEGEIAFGSNISIEWEWHAVNEGSVETAVREWVAPDWTRDMATESVEEEKVRDYYAEALAALPAVGSLAPDIQGVNLSGDSISLAQMKGDLVYLDFWYIGCGPCMSALPHLEKAHREFNADGFRVLGVNHHQSAPTVQRYLDRRELDIPQAILGDLPEGYSVMAYPTWCLVGRDGLVLARDIGFGDSGIFLDSLVQANL
ncbi:TlpA family protein disulfide reductase, partial [Flavobacteriales bacterium]|nr:TlpA family protein disulfide reductase [Flavobacteriales bacterium]